MKKNHYIFLMLSPFTKAQQYKTTDFFTTDADSVTVSTIYYRDKTTQLPNINKKDSIGNIIYQELQDSIGIIATATLNIREIKQIIHNMRGIRRGHALPTEYDIQINFYKKRSLIQTANISFYTKNITVKKNGCKTFFDKDNNEIDPCFFLGMINKKFKIFLKELLLKKNLWKKDDNFFKDL